MVVDGAATVAVADLVAVANTSVAACVHAVFVVTIIAAVVGVAVWRCGRCVIILMTSVVLFAAVTFVLIGVLIDSPNRQNRFFPHFFFVY